MHARTWKYLCQDLADRCDIRHSDVSFDKCLVVDFVWRKVWLGIRGSVELEFQVDQLPWRKTQRPLWGRRLRRCRQKEGSRKQHAEGGTGVHRSALSQEERVVRMHLRSKCSIGVERVVMRGSTVGK